ncbi:MAG: hypothetical protein KF773_39840 [Deltaproteobacteria bacterium]|nr:hypothetical protein [Deltaproteobacteria bacterium]
MGKWLIAFTVVVVGAGSTRAEGDGAAVYEHGITVASSAPADAPPGVERLDPGTAFADDATCGHRTRTGLVAVFLAGIGLFVVTIVGLLVALVFAIARPRPPGDELPEALSLLTVDVLAAARRRRYALGMVFAATAAAAMFAYLDAPFALVFPSPCFLVGLAGWLRTRHLHRLLALPDAAADRVGRIVVVRAGHDAATFRSSDAAIRNAQRRAVPRSVVL